VALANFTPSAYGSLVAPSPAPLAVAPFTAGAAATTALPGGGGPTLLIGNNGPCACFVLLAATALLAAAVSGSNGTFVPVNGQVALAVGSNGFLGAVGAGGNAQLFITQGA
jgi:hypothetical protein